MLYLSKFKLRISLDLANLLLYVFLKDICKILCKFLSPPKDIFSHYFLERGRVRNINLLFSCTCPVQGLNPQAEYVP